MFDVRFWGVRGSVATAGVDRAGVGGNTSCVELLCGTQRLILDAGTGLRQLGAGLMQSQQATDRSATLLLSHYHWDHIQGLPFFAPAYSDKFNLKVIGPQPTEQPKASVRDLLAHQMNGPYFPVGMDAMRAQMEFGALVPGESMRIGDVAIRTCAARHPNTCIAYRVEYNGHTVVYATDTEHNPDNPEPDANLAALARDADVLIYDAQYTEDEYATKRGWGHSTPDAATLLAQHAGVKQLELFHHDPSHTDWTVASMEASARLQFKETLAAREGQVIQLGAKVAKAA
jgi:phosphoribosyl 1,2-cyclic phosphodiesterase